MATSEDIALIQNRMYSIKFKLVLYNNDSYIPETELQTTAKSVNCTISAESDIRRTASLVLTVEDEDLMMDNFEIAWVDKRIELYIGLEDSQGVFHYYLLGTFLLDSDNSKYDATSRELVLSLVDMMACATACRGSQIGSDVIIPYNSNLRGAIQAFVARTLQFKRSNVQDFGRTVPYDQEFSAGVYPYEVLNQLVTLYPYCEHFYSIDGIYTVQAIPTGINDPIFLDETVLDDLIISEERSGVLGNIKNSTEIWGKELDALYTANSCTTGTKTTQNDMYILNFPITLEAAEANSTYSFVPGTTNLENHYIQISWVETVETTVETEVVDAASEDPVIVRENVQTQETKTGQFKLYDSNGSALSAGAITAGRSYVAKLVYVQNGDDLEGRFYLQGEELIHVIVREVNAMPSAQAIASDKAWSNCDNIQYVVNADSPYACDRNGMAIDDGELKQVLQGNDYAFINTTELAYERGAYENYCKARLNTSVTLKTVLIPWMDVNKKIRYTSPKTGDVLQYLVKEIDMDLTGFTMTMKLSRFYNAYPWL